MDLARRGLGQVGHEFHDAREFMLGEFFAGEGLEFLHQCVAAVAIGDDECLHHLPPLRVGHADDGAFQHHGMFEQRVFDLDRAHRPAGRDDDDNYSGFQNIISLAIN